MNLEQFGEELKKARIQKEVTLEDISVETRINVKFLEAIENGKFHILPQTYIRAFLREYALIVGLNPIDTLELYDSAKQESSPNKVDTLGNRRYTIEETIPLKEVEERIRYIAKYRLYFIFTALILIALIVATILSYNNKDILENKPLTEISFDNVIRENDATSIPASTLPVDTTPLTPVIRNDSLRLEITTIDSVWISLLIDNKKGEAYLLGPNRKRSWTAKERFSITMGNAGGAVFQLNGRDIGALGKRGAVVRNAIITDSYQKIQ